MSGINKLEEMNKRSTSQSTPQPRSYALTLRWAIAAVVVVLWLFGIVAAYFWAHKPFDADILGGLGRTLSSLMVWLGITWLGAAVGRRVARGLLADETPSVRFALSTGLGLGALSLAVLGLGLAGLLRPLVAWGLVLLLSLLLRREFRASLADLSTGLADLKSSLSSAAGRFEWWLRVYILASLALTFLTALAPPTSWDALVYHLTGPRLFVEAGRIIHTLDLAYLGFPQLGEMGFTLGMLLAGDGVAPLLHFGYGLLALVVTAGLARRAFGERSAWLAMALLLSVPSLLSLMSWAYVEATLLFYVTAALYAFIRWRESRAPDQPRSRGWLSLAAAFCGFSAGVKYTAIAVPVALGLLVLWAAYRDGLRAAVVRIAQLAVVTVIVALPWLLENWLTTGNPVYPFFFSGVHWDAWRAWWYDRPGTGLATTAPWRLVIAPLEATVLGVEGGDPYDATIGPLLLMTAPLLIVVWRALNREERSLMGYLLFYAGVNYGLWLVGLARSALLVQTRLLLPIFGMVAIMGAVGVDRLATLRRPQLAVDWLARSVIALTLGFLLFSTLTTFLQVNPLPVAFGLESRDHYLARRLGAYHLAIEAINSLPPDSQVVFLWEPRSYACRVDCRPDALLDRFLHLSHLYPDATSIARLWREEGVTHVLLYRLGMQAIIEDRFDPISPHDLDVLADLQAAYLQPVYDDRAAYTLYALESEP